jgi:hypothetical protein
MFLIDRRVSILAPVCVGAMHAAPAGLQTTVAWPHEWEKIIHNVAKVH